MGQQEFLAELGSTAVVGLDANSAIYYLSGSGARHELVRSILSLASKGDIEIQMCGVVELELLVRPFRERDAIAQRNIVKLLEGTRGVRMTAVSRSVLVAAAEVRAATNMRTPDAIIVAAAVLNGCGAIVGNDNAFRRLAQVDPERWVVLKNQRQSLPAYLHVDDYTDKH